jgi:hypothetical protein
MKSSIDPILFVIFYFPLYEACDGHETACADCLHNASVITSYFNYIQTFYKCQEKRCRSSTLRQRTVQKVATSGSAGIALSTVIAVSTGPISP